MTATNTAFKERLVELAQARGVPFKRGNPWGRAGVPTRFRCIYCRKKIYGRGGILQHETHCTAKDSVKRVWAIQLAVARRKSRQIRGIA